MVCMIADLFIIEDKKEETLEDEYIKGDVQVQERGQLSDISISYVNQEVEVGGFESYGNEVHYEGMFIGDSNAETFTRGTDKGDIQSPVQVNEESKTLENNFFNIPREFSLDVQKSDHKQRESNMDKAVRIHAQYAEFFYP